MTPLFKKLNLGLQEKILVVNAPKSFEAEISKLDKLNVLTKATKATRCSFLMAFAITHGELDSFSKKLVDAADGDAILWVAYPKATSKKYRCEFNRDSGWSVLGAAGFEPVRQVAIDEDWSALRFRRIEHIRVMKRRNEMTISEEGKRRTAKKTDAKN
jgi:hypothetical protein